jgi:hypothetical protein
MLECNIYGQNMRHTTSTQAELEQWKGEVQLEVQQLEFKQKKLLQGHDEKDNRRSLPMF